MNDDAFLIKSPPPSTGDIPHQNEKQSEDGMDFFNLSEDLVKLPQMRQASSSTIDFDGLLTKPLILWEDLKNGCGGQLWPAGMILAKYLLKNEDLIKNKSM